MSTQEERLRLAAEDAATLRQMSVGYEQPELDAIAHRLDKLVRHVVDRDKGPTLEVRSENNDLKEKLRLETELRQKAEADLEAKEKARLELKERMNQLRGRIAELEKGR